MNRDRPVARQLDLPLSRIEARYGPGNVDDAGDEIINILRELGTWPDQYGVTFEFSSGPPGFRALEVRVTGMDDPAWAVFTVRLRLLWLLEE